MCLDTAFLHGKARQLHHPNQSHVANLRLLSVTAGSILETKIIIKNMQQHITNLMQPKLDGLHRKFNHLVPFGPKLSNCTRLSRESHSEFHWSNVRPVLRGDRGVDYLSQGT